MTQLSIQQAFALGLQHHQAGRLQEAEQIYRQILARQPQHVDALHCLGVMAHHVGRHDTAVELIRRALVLRPNFAEAYNNLGNALKAEGQIDGALAAYRQAIALKPAFAEAQSNLGVVLYDVGRLDEAVAAYRQAVAIAPDYAIAHNNLGNAFYNLERLDEAIAAYRHAIALNPNFPQAHFNLGNACRDQGQLDAAIAAFRKAIACDPNWPLARNNLANALKDTGQLDDAITAYRQAVAIDPANSSIDSNLVYALHFHPGYDGHAIAEETRRWNRQHAEPLRQFIESASTSSERAHRNDPSPERRLRIGYVSPDFRAHCQSLFMAPLLGAHDRQQVETICYSQTRKPDERTRELRNCCDGWRDIAAQSDEEVAAVIRQDQIDILVDLTMHMAESRLLVFARKPAPLQVSWLAYPGSTGLSAIDYRLSDPYLDPPGMDESIYSEKTIRLPDSFWCYDPLDCRDIPVNLLPALEAGAVTFGCLNNFCKVNEEVVALWSQVLQRAKNSRLLLLTPQGSHRQRMRERLSRDGIDPGRVEFVEHQPRRAYLELYHRIDVGLDTFPYNGHTTSLDSFWMGVPVVTLVGHSAVSRAGWCQLSNLGLAELAAQTPVQFLAIAVELAADMPRLQELRGTLRRRMEQSPLMDAPRFARGIEAAYRQMWRAWCQTASPVH